ncbi:Sirohydrochlorin ferrochelatase [Raineyella antarctica]|uniref:Sirohydrochlorin ferrochelatase n=1 Tax=Raineyella antarctica TaxID=1577474 RepID=A0A1G6GRV0_9ACTN|nr:CbiX/SirB N-terminal domain-containing protein [Raineyella antarctica]SDB83916.1 Sirohydrochlorin ferrochelatase [Raineyella antarctica]
MTAPALVLLAHGHSDPQIAEITHVMRHELMARSPELTVRAAYLGSSGPSPVQVVSKLARLGTEEVVLVPLEIGCAYRASAVARDELGRLTSAFPELRFELARPIGPEPVLLTLLDRTLRQALSDHHVTELDGLVLSSAGSEDIRSRSLLARRTRQWGLHHKLACVTAFTDDTGPSVEDAIETLWHQGRRHIAVGSWFLSASDVWVQQAESALAAGAIAVSRPMSAGPEIAELAMHRYLVGAMDLIDFGDLLPEEESFEDDSEETPRLQAIGA